MPLIRIATQSELPASNTVKEFPCGDKTICIANVNGTYSAMDNICLHRGGPLGAGVILNGKVICPWHGWEWEPKTGVHDEHARIAVYAMKIENGEVLVDI